jgi:hypothetical protein
LLPQRISGIAVVVGFIDGDLRGDLDIVYLELID